MAINGDNQSQPDRRLRGRHANRENDEHHAGQRFGMFAVTPVGNEVQVRRVEHQLDADEDDDRVAAAQSAGQTDREESGGEK